MCLMPFGSGGSMLIPPTDKARKLATYLRVGLVFHFLLILLLFLSGRFVDGVFDFLGLLIGLFAIRSSEGYSIQQLLCYCIFTGIDFIWSCIREIIFFASNSTTSNIALSDWNYYIGVIVLVAAPFIYVYVCVTSYFLYQELKLVVQELAAAFDDPAVLAGGQPPAMFGGQQGYYQQPPAMAAAGAQPAAATAAQASGFRAFAGTGHRLG